jgi:hypothetical protein
MSWSQSFIDSLSSPSKGIYYILRFLGSSIDYNLSNGETIGIGGEVRIGSADVTIDTSAITPQRWSINFGGFTITVQGDIRPVLSKGFIRGAMAELILVRNGSRNRVCIGQLRNISGVRNVWTLEFADFLTAMQTRLTTSADKNQFWYNAGKTAKVTTSFNYSSDTRLYLDDITIFEKETGQNGMIYVTDSVHGESDYYLWDSKTITSGSAGYLNIVATGVYPSLTSHAHLHVNDEVKSVVRLRGRADYIFARTVMSTGARTQGAFDDYPLSWSFGALFNPNLFSVQELNEYYKEALKPSSGDNELELVIEEPSNINTLLDAFLTLGIWPVWRQNTLAIRACSDPNFATHHIVVDHITDRDIIAITSHSLYSPSQSSIYGSSRLRYYDSGSGFATRVSSGQSIQSIPAEESIERDATRIYRPSVAKYSSEKDISRLQSWDKRPYEELTIDVTEKHAVLSSGDIVEISSNYIYGIRENTASSYSHRRAMVLSVRWSPSRSRVSLSLAVMS